MLKHTLLITALLLGAGEARAGLIFSATPCGGAGQNPCTVTQAYQPPIHAAPLGEQDFALWFAALVGPDPHFGWIQTGSNVDYAIGHVNGTDNIHTGYINGPTGLICCMGDDPFRITGINANGLLIGVSALGSEPFFTSVGELAFESLPVVISGLPVGFNDEMVAIDDGNNILARRGLAGAYYELRPVDDVPTPGAVWLLGAGLLAGAALRSLSGFQHHGEPKRFGPADEIG